MHRGLKSTGYNLYFFLPDSEKNPSGLCFYNMAATKKLWRLSLKMIFLYHCSLDNIQSRESGTGLLGFRPPV